MKPAAREARLMKFIRTTTGTTSTSKDGRATVTAPPSIAKKPTQKKGARSERTKKKKKGKMKATE